jgi:hypothetical protein
MGRPDPTRHRVRGDLYRNPAVFRLELERIWYRAWVYVGRESEIPKPHDFVRKSIGLQPILMTRGQDGRILWFKERVVRNGGRLKKAAIVALARKLLVALWKYVAAGVVIEGAIMKAA